MRLKKTFAKLIKILFLVGPDHSDQRSRRRRAGLLAGEHTGDKYRHEGHVWTA